MNSKIEKLIKQFAKLPRVGGRAAQRIVLALLQDKTGRAAMLAAALIDAAETIKPCSICGCLADSDVCEFCRDMSRADGRLCIVRDLGDVWTIEKSGVFRGRYHIIGGLLSAAAGTIPEDLNISNIPARIADEKIAEVIFALPNTVEGKTTQHFIINKVQGIARFSELASGVPLGGDLDYIDDGTLSIAFDERKQI
ncbi:MAG: recombination mediator RecR [Alphaproteobacteria bacterium]|nr:recombination mediator RecR [Alphaproteobacteria bacterium]